ncbi:MAG: D-alanyl-D-alanine carboxypeptidase/D-alanyl-D-alanine-endopeptidase [Flavobacteriales bacterium]|nr:D-alanyl-D-alanine carboxypeptidase/D-alanyl-D-alanine-endopeptidase [Flavobacteriales bacterium]
MKRLLTLILFFSIASISGAQVVVDTSMNSLEKAVELFLKDPDLKNCAFSFYAYNSKSGKVIADKNGSMSIVPASCMKVITTASALEILGGSYRFKTSLQYTGYIDQNCVLHGDLYIRGGGDPTLGSKFFTDGDPSEFLNQWALEVRNAGIDSITGNVIADAEIYGWEMVPSTWAWGDIGNGYGAAPCGISIYDNTCVLSFKTGEKAGDVAHIECMQPYVPNLEFVNEVYSSNVSEDNSYIFGAPYSYDRIIKGTLPKGREAFEVKGTIPDPGYLAAFELRYALAKWGIGVAGITTTVRELKLEKKYNDTTRINIYDHFSPSVASIVNLTNTYSVNLFAEHLMNQIGLIKYGNATVGSGTAAVTEFWTKKGIDTKGFYITDGSGLSRFDAVSAKHLVDILLYMSRSKNASTFEKSLPVAGKSGTLSNFCKGTKAAGNVWAKSGTMTRVKAYSGYAKSAKGEKIVFSVIVNNFNCSTKQMEKKLEKLAIAMVEFQN